MAVGAGPAVAGNVLDDRQHAAVEQAGAGRPRQRATRAGSRPKARSPMTSWPCGWRTSSTGAQSTSMPSRRSSAAISRALSQLASRARPSSTAQQAADHARPAVPPASAAASAAAPGRLPGRSAPAHRRGRRMARRLCDQGADLRRLGTVAGEQDEAERIGLGEEPALLAARARARPARRSPPAARLAGTGRAVHAQALGRMMMHETLRPASATAQRPRLGLARPAARRAAGRRCRGRPDRRAPRVGARPASRSAFLPFSLAQAPLTSSAERPANSCTW